MAKRNKTKKLFKSNLKLEALEQRQLLAGITGSGTELTPGGSGADKFIVASNGNHYDQVLLTGTSVTVTNDTGNITRVSFLDLQGDIVQAEFGGAGTLTVSLDPATAVAGVQPTKYNQTLTGGYEQGLATFTIQGSDATTNFTVFSVGSATAFAGNTLFDSTHTGGNNTADVQRITVVANPSNPNGSTFGGIRAGNAVFGAASGVVGITAANVQVQDVVTVGDIKASGTATPTLVFGTASQFGQVTIAGGGLVQANGASINDSGSYKFGLTLAAGSDANGVALPAQTAPTGLSFSDNNPIAAQTKTFTLTTGVDSITGTSGNDSINGQIGTAGSATPTLTGLDSIDGGAGTDQLSINDIQGNQTLPGGITIKNVEVLNLASVGIANIDTSGSNLTGLTTLNIVASTGADSITAGSAQAVTVFDSAGTVTLAGGSTQTVTTAGGVALSKATGAIVATDTAQGAATSTIQDGTTVNLTNSADLSAANSGTITVGLTSTHQPTGTVTIVSNLTGDSAYANSRSGGAITVYGGTTDSVTINATSPANTVAASNKTVTESAVNVNGAAGVTTTVTVNQAANIGATTTVLAIAAATEVDSVVFTTIPAGQSINLGGVILQAPAGGLTAAKAAAAYANLTNGQLSGFTSGAVSGVNSDTVTFTATGTGGSTTAGANAINMGGNNIKETLVFTDLSANTSTTTPKSITILGLTYTAPSTAAVPLATLATFFSSQTYNNGTETTLGNAVEWLAAAPTTTTNAGDTVVFTATAAGIADTYFSGASQATGYPINATQVANVATITETVQGLKATSAAGRGGVAAGVVTIQDGNYTGTSTNTIASASLTNYGTSSAVNSNALTSLTLKNTSPGTSSGGSSTGTVTIGNTVATSLDLTVDGGSTGSLGTITAPTYTTVKVHATGSNTTTNITAAAATTLTVDGTKVLTLGTTTSLAGLTSVAVSGSAGLAADLSLGTWKNTLATVDASASSGAMTVTIDPTGTAATSYKGGSGADNVTITGVPTKAIDGGAGTSDTLTLATTLVTNPSTNANITGFETLATATGAGGGSYDATGFTGLSNGQAGVTFTNVAAGTALTISGAATAPSSTTYTAKDSTGSADALTINVAGTGTVTTAGFESVAVVAGNSTDALTLVDSAGTPTVTKITVTTGSSGKALTLVATGNTALATVDGSALTTALTYTTEGTKAETVTGGTANDVLTAKAGTSADTLIGGAGNDTLTANAGLDTLTGGSGNDTFVVATPASALNTYSVITDASVGDGVVLKNLGVESFAATKVTLQNTAVFQDYANTVATNGGDASANAAIGWFQFNGDTYIVESLHDATNAGTPSFKNGTDLVVKLSGLIDLSAAALVQTGYSPEIVIR